MGNCWSIFQSICQSSESIDAIESIREICEEIDPVEQIDPLISFVENQLFRMNDPSKAGSSSSEGWLETVRDGTKLAAKTIHTISTESDSVEAMRSLTLKLVKGVEDLYWVFIALSTTAVAVESHMRVRCTENECEELLRKNVELAKEVKKYSENMPAERRSLCHAVATIVEGAVICCDYWEKHFRFWSPTTATAQLEKTNQILRILSYSLGLSVEDADVFLSHSGKQKNFVRQLSRDLKMKHVSCFFDEDSLPLAQMFPPMIFKAAETCKIAVLVLSKDFINSKWPMLELSAFISAMNSGKNANLKLLPIFFMISPNELCHLTKDSPEWQKLEESNYTRDKWQNALKVVRSINGLHFSENDNEVVFRDKVVEAIRNLLKDINPESPLQLLDFEPVGIEEQVRNVKELLNMKGAEPALVVIVCGFGGMGKTTVAAAAVQSLDWFSRDFKFCRIAIDDKAPDKTSHIIKLQQDILYDLGGERLYLRDPHDGRRKIKEAIQNKCSLLFIDNVVDKDYILDLLPKDLTSGEQETKLRIIITSRGKHVIAEFNIMGNIICKEYEVKGLSNAASKNLISKIILQNQVLNTDFDEDRMINKVAIACSGVPLLLSVFGKHLGVERNKDNYQEALDVLEEGNLDSYRDEDLGTKLMFVYNKIKDMEVKEAFMDICTYFHGWEWNFVADIVDFRTLADLRRRMLVSKNGSGEVIVHDILRLMGMKEARFTRFSNYNDISFPDVLDDNLDGVVDVKGISLLNDNRLITIKSTQLEAMHQSLRVLMLGDWVTLDGPPCNKTFKNLRYLRLGDISVFPFKDPSKLDKIRVFVNRSKPAMNLSHLPSSLKRISHEVPDVQCDEFAKLPFQNLSSLKSFIVKARKSFELGLPSVKLPGELQLPVSLVHLDLSGCKNLPDDIGHLTSLESLILDRSDLKCLPQGIGKLKELKHLSMDYCSKLDFLSEELGMLSSLEALSMKYCQNLRALPESLGGLSYLQKLELSGSINLQQLPESLGMISSLEAFSMENCENLKALPKSLGGLPSLQNLELNGSIKLQLLPESFGELRIQQLKLRRLVNLQELPNSFGITPLKDLCLERCQSLMSLPDSFVQLKMLETLNIKNCTKLGILPENFGRIRYLKQMTVEDCPLRELPHGFGALPALKSFTLRRCNSFVNLPRDFTELTNLEELYLHRLPLISSIPDGFRKLEKLRFLFIKECFQLKTLSYDFGNMLALERLWIKNCSELEGAMMEKILNLQHCYMVDIHGCKKLLETWRHMQSEIEHPIAVFGGADSREAEENRGRAIRVALLNGKCMEVKNPSDELVECSSMLVGLKEGTRATLALIMLPMRTDSDQHQRLRLFVKMAKERAKSNGSGKLQIVCARKPVWSGERPTQAEEEERAEEGICQILMSLPKGSCAIPSSESARLKIITLCCDGTTDWSNRDGSFYYDNRLSFFMANVGINVEGRPSFEKLEFTGEDHYLKHYDRDRDGKHYNSIQNFIRSICPAHGFQSQSECGAGENKRRQFVEALKDNGLNYLLTNNNMSKVMVDDLCAKTIGFIICNFKTFECIKLQRIYKDLQQKDSNFIAIWIPTDRFEACGHGTYTRLTQCMPWATFPYPQLIKVERGDSRFIVLDKEGQIANQDAMSLLLGWGVKLYPFTQHAIRESFFMMEQESDSCLEFLVHGISVVGRKPMKSKMTFLYAQHPREWRQMKSKLEELTQIPGSFEVLYVGCRRMNYIENCKQEYADATKNMRWPSLSFSDMIMLWHRWEYLASEKGYKFNKESNIVRVLRYSEESFLLVVDKEGVVTWRGEEVVQMICESSDEISDGQTMRMVKEELMKSLSRGECTPIVKTFFRDEIHNL